MSAEQQVSKVEAPRRALLRGLVGLPLLALAPAVPAWAANRAAQGIVGPLTASVLLGLDKSQAWHGILSNYVYALSCEGKSGLGKFFYVVPGSRKVSVARVEVMLGQATETPAAGAGLIFNVSDDGASYLGLVLHPGGHVKLWQRSPDGMQELGVLDLGPVDLSAKPKGPVTLEIRASATGGDLVVEDTVIGSFEGDQLMSGGAGIIAVSPGRFGYRNFSLKS